jgi:hypothetical protein
MPPEGTGSLRLHQRPRLRLDHRTNARRETPGVLKRSVAGFPRDTRLSRSAYLQRAAVVI